MVSLSVTVPDDGEDMAAVADAVEAEVRPDVGRGVCAPVSRGRPHSQEGVDDDAAVQLGP